MQLQNVMVFLPSCGKELKSRSNIDAILPSWNHQLFILHQRQEHRYLKKRTSQFVGMIYSPQTGLTLWRFSTKNHLFIKNLFRKCIGACSGRGLLSLCWNWKYEVHILYSSQQVLTHHIQRRMVNVFQEDPLAFRYSLRQCSWLPHKFPWYIGTTVHP